MSHTPTPWKWHDSTLRTDAPNRHDQLFIMEASVMPHPWAKALIETAPELLQALINIVKMVEDGDLTTIELNEARAAIAKAEGRG